MLERFFIVDKVLGLVLWRGGKKEGWRVGILGRNGGKERRGRNVSMEKEGEKEGRREEVGMEWGWWW